MLQQKQKKLCYYYNYPPVNKIFSKCEFLQKQTKNPYSMTVKNLKKSNKSKELKKNFPSEFERE